jgi:uncharacterized protein (DUF1810 family)
MPDTYDLDRFVQAQSHNFDQALEEIRAGQKRSHWMWYVFPQLAGLGFSPTAQHYAIKGEGEARAYLAHPVLGPRLHQCCAAALAVKSRTATEIFGSIDGLKLRSSATLFARVSPPGSVFAQILDRFYGGVPDEKTLQLLGAG